MDETRGVLLFNRGDKCVVRAIVALYTLRQHWQGDVTFFLEDPYPHEFDEVCKYFNVNIVHCEQNLNVNTLVRKTELFINSPYDRTLWIDADTIVVGKIDEMFDYLDNCDVAIPHFAGWVSNGGAISKRINRYIGIAEQKYVDEALKNHPAINTGVLAYRKNIQFMKDWIKLAQLGDGKMFIPDEVAFQVLYPSYERIFIAPEKYNVSVRFGVNEPDKRIVHFHGKKHCLDFGLCYMWKEVFEHMRKENIANINSFLKYADKRLSLYLKGIKNATCVSASDEIEPCVIECSPVCSGFKNDEITIVTACDPKYFGHLRTSLPNWIKHKQIDKFQGIVYVNGFRKPWKNSELDFIRQLWSKAKIIEWNLPNAESQRENMLSAFVLGAAKDVQTPYWVKIDADAFAANNEPLLIPEMKEFVICGHKWGYSFTNHIEALIKWSNSKTVFDHTPKDVFDKSKVDGRRYMHPRVASYVQFHKSDFVRMAAEIAGEKLPVPSHDTYLWYVADRLGLPVLRHNFKRKRGMGNKSDLESLKTIINGIDTEDTK